MNEFKPFLDARGPAEKCVKIAAGAIEPYSGRVPQSLVDFWTDRGFCSFAEDFLWTTNPAEFDAVLKLWLGKGAKDVVIARSGFGHLFIWNGSKVKLLHVHFGGVSEIAPKVELLFNSSFCSDRYLDAGLDRKLFLKARKKLGQLVADECFGYEPALALGGSGKLDTIRKVKIIPHLALLSQLQK